MTKEANNKGSAGAQDNTPISPSDFQTPFLVVTSKKEWRFPSVKELWAYREIIYGLAWRDIRAHYRQSGLGMLWILIKPFAQMVAFTFLFGHVAQLSSEGLPYPIFNFAALVPWTYFSVVMAQSTNTVVSSAHLYMKLWFPRMALPLSHMLSSSLDMAIQFAILSAMMYFYGISISWNIVWLPLFLMLMFVTVLGTSLLLCTINVMFRDVTQALPLILQIWLFCSPVVYSSQLFSDKWKYLMAFNPMTAVINGIRWSILGTATGPDETLWISVAVAVLVLIVGALMFQRWQRVFPDYLLNP